MPAHSGIFFDRDGTLIHDPGYLHEPEKVALLPGVAETLLALYNILIYHLISFLDW